MAEKIVIAELNLDAKNIIKEAQDVKKSLESLKEENKNLKKSGLESSQQFIANEAAIKGLSSQYNAQKTALQQLVTKNGELKNSSEAIAVAYDRENVTISQTRANNSELLKLRNELDLSTKEGTDTLALINKKLDENNAFIKQNVSAYEQQKIGIGDYQTAIAGALKDTGLFGGSLREIQGVLTPFAGVFSLLKAEVAGAFSQIKNAAAGTEALTKSQKIAAITTNALSGALKLFRIALISTGIGAIVVVLGSLISFLATTQAGIDKVTSVTRPLQAIFSTLVGVLQDVGKFLFAAFSNPLESLKTLYAFVKDQLIKQFEAFSKIVEGLLTFDFDLIKEGFSDLGDQVAENLKKVTDAAKQFGQAINDAAKKGAEIDRLQKEIEKKEIDIIQLRAKTNLQLKEQENIAKNTALSSEKREAAVKEQERLAKNLVNEENKILDLQIKQLEIKQSLNDTSREEIKQLEELRAQRITNEERIADIEKRNIGVVKQLRDEAAAAALAAIKERQDANIAELEQLFALELEKRRFSKDTLEDLRKDAADEIIILQEKLKAKKLSELEFQTEVLRIQNDLKEIQITQQEEELQRTKDFNDKKQALEDELFLQSITNDQERAEAKALLDFEKKLFELEEMNLNEQEKTELLTLFEQERNNQIQSIRDKARQDERNAQFLADKAEIESKKRQTLALTSLASQAAGVLKGILGNSLAARLAGIAIDAAIAAARVQIETSSAQAINLAQATLVAPPPFNLGAITAALAQNGFLQANAIKNIGFILGSAAIQGIGTVASFEQGGIVGIDGNRHSQGGVPIFAGNKLIGEAEGGEGIGILNRPAYGAFMDFNNKFGSGKIGTTMAESGGIITNDINKESLGSAFQNTQRSVVYVEDIRLGINNANEIEVNATI